MAESKYRAILDQREPEEQTEGEGRRRGRPSGKRSNPDYTQVTAYIPQKLYTDVRIALLQDGGGQFSELVADVLLGWLERRGEG